MRGANNVEICCIEGFDIPEYSDQDTAIASLDNLTIPDDNRESAWKFEDHLPDYINQHAKQDAESSVALRLKDGLMIALPTALSKPPCLLSRTLQAKTPHFEVISGLDTSAHRQKHSGR